ncbi:MAG: AGE family epimerase/isomerase [Treponema sp.]|jgi:mannobiose 2-epimerase|nr:AGE family epimerase/isomerase [Treponema sp.]
MLNKQTAIQEIRNNILPFWQNLIDEKNGGFHGATDFYGNIYRNAAKGCILNSRILWTFSAAYRMFGDPAYKNCAQHAHNFLTANFLDKTRGGLYWLADHTGYALDTKKHFYNIAFGIYALSEHYAAVKNKTSLDLAMALFEMTENYGLDPSAGGYIEACDCDWRNIEDFRLSEKDLNCPKSMNTNLHILEAYTNLTRVSEDKYVRKALEKLLRIMLDKIVNQDWHFNLFFDMDWNSLVKEISYGHDIEGSWLLYEAALAVGDEDLISKTKQAALAIAEVTYNTAIDLYNGGLFSSCNSLGYKHQKKEWWPQAEAVVGFYNAFELSGEKKYFDAAGFIWSYIQKSFVDQTNGEWHNELHPDNTPDKKLPKSSFWKCPYHNTRACLEIARRMAE